MRLFLSLLAAMAVALGVAACGGDDGSPTAAVDSTAPAETQPANGGVAVVSNGKFKPEEIYEKASPGVVTITSLFGDADATEVPGLGPAAGQGAGFVISDSGEILTNAHVVTSGGEDGSGKLTPAKEIYVDFADRNKVPAKLIGFDAFADVALVKVDPSGLDLTSLKLDDGRGLVAGQPVAAIGSPFGESLSLSVGVISALERSIQSLTKFTIDNAIQTDASINPGNSGGPLLNANVEVIGINQQIDTSSGSNSGVGFAVPITAVRNSLEQLRDKGKVDYSYIGVTSQTLYPQLSKHLKLGTESGALVSDVVKGGPADKAGIQEGSDEIRFQANTIKTGGDVILAVDGVKIVEPADLARYISKKRPGDEVTLEILRDGSKEQVKVKLAARPLSVPE